MFDKYLLIDGSARRIAIADKPGLSVDIRIAYYRGLWLSMIEELELIIDQVRTLREHTMFTIHGNTYRVSELENEISDRWGYTEAATLQVRLEKPIVAGEHTLELTERLRISYLPAPAVSRCCKVMWVA